jgi:hypothetical protein
MKTKDINKSIDVVAETAKELNLKASIKLHKAMAQAGYALQETAEKVAQSAEELAWRAGQLARQASPKPVARKHPR